MDHSAANALFALTDRELWLVTSQAGSQPAGLIATFVCQAALPPELPRVLIGIAKQHHTWQAIEQCGAFALHLLGEEHLELVWRFGLASGHTGNKFEGSSFRRSQTGSPLFDDLPGWLDCRVEARFDTGDRTAYLAEVIDAQLNRRDPPLTMHRLLKLAPADKLQELRRQREQDSLLDAEAIRAWRAACVNPAAT